ncbi:MAG: TolC family protein [Pyrinomonadaceae bacterium]|nr:TolC family protein [Blastocatellia bacterium]MCW5956671.1 TolC family protein [Pyrinomonadaceae bacterium]
MKRQLFIFIAAFILIGGTVTAQDPTPTPTATPVVVDKQNVAPEKLEGVPPIAPNYRSDDRSLPDLGRVGVDMMDQRSLTLNDAIAMALENNNDIEVTRKNVKIAEFDLRAARGFYQPRLTGQTYYERSTTPNVSIFSSNQETTLGSFVGNVGVTGFIPSFGTVLRADVNNQRQTSTNPISILSPQENASIGFSLTQPLFRGRRFDQNRRTIEIAKRNLSLTDVQFRQRTIETIATVQRAYWDLAFALRNLQVQRDGVKDAKDQYEHNKRLVSEGQLAPIDIVAAETQVANFEQAVYEALNVVNQAENALKNLISPNKNAKVWSESLTPTDPVDLTPPDTTLKEALDLAIANRPELELNQVQRDINAIDRKFYGDLKKPQIDLVASYTSAGIGGDQNPNFRTPFPLACEQDPTSPACQQQRANLALLTGNAYTGVFNNRYPTYRVGLTVNLPLFGDKTAGAQYGKSLVEGEKIETQRAQLEQNIQVDVRNSIQAVRTAEAKLRAAAIARENSVKQYDSEQRKLDAGQSDIYKVLERQTALTSARSAELRAQTELNKAIADLQRATGNSLKANNVEARLRK